MRSLFRRRPSPAMIVAMIALFVSLSGVSYGVATGFIDSREIKNNEVRSIDLRNNQIRTRDLRNNEVRGIDIRNSTVQGRDIALNTVTGSDISEGTLGKVPSATSADSATTAGSAASANTANSVGGVSLRRVSYAGEMGDPFVEILNDGGLQLKATCTGAGALQVRANPSAPDSWIGSAFEGTASSTVNDDDFDPGDDTLLANGDEGLGHIAYAGSDGRQVNVTVLARQLMDGVRGTNDCGLFGTASLG